MSTLVSVLLALLAPYFVSVERFSPKDCGEFDPLGPCLGERIVIENPRRKPVEILISCGDEGDEQMIRISARTKLILEVELTIPPSKELACQLISWRDVK